MVIGLGEVASHRRTVVPGWFMPSGRLLQFPIRHPYLFTREINTQVLGSSEFNRILFAAIRALPHVQDSGRREELKQALCDLLLEEDAAV